MIGNTPEKQSDKLTLLRAKVSESYRALAAAEGIPPVSGSFEQTVVDLVVTQLAALPSGDVSRLQINDGRMVSAMNAGFGSALSQLTQEQRLAVRHGYDPYNAAVLRELAKPEGLIRLAAGTLLTPQEEARTATGRSSRLGYGDLRSQDETRAAETRQFAGLGLGATTITAFNAIGLDRIAFEHYRLQGFSQQHIAAAARDAQDLGFRGRADRDIAIKAPTDLREAAGAVSRAETPEEREAAQRHYDEMRKKYENLPDSDPRKQDAANFIRRVAEGDRLEAKQDQQAVNDKEDRKLLAENQARGTAAGIADVKRDEAKANETRTAEDNVTNLADAFGLSGPTQAGEKSSASDMLTKNTQTAAIRPSVAPVAGSKPMGPSV